MPEIHPGAVALRTESAKEPALCRQGGELSLESCLVAMCQKLSDKWGPCEIQLTLQRNLVRIQTGEQFAILK